MHQDGVLLRPGRKRPVHPSQGEAPPLPLGRVVEKDERPERLERPPGCDHLVGADLRVGLEEARRLPRVVDLGRVERVRLPVHPGGRHPRGHAVTEREVRLDVEGARVRGELGRVAHPHEAVRLDGGEDLPDEPVQAEGRAAAVPDLDPLREQRDAVVELVVDEHGGLDPRPFRRLELQGQADPRRRPRKVARQPLRVFLPGETLPGRPGLVPDEAESERIGAEAFDPLREQVVVDRLPHEPAHVESAAVDLDHRLGADRADLAGAGHQVVERHRGGVRRQADRAAQEAVREGERTGRRPRTCTEARYGEGSISQSGAASAARGEALASRAATRRAVPLVTPRSPPRGSSRGRQPPGRGGPRTPRGPAPGSGCSRWGRRPGRPRC